MADDGKWIPAPPQADKFRRNDPASPKATPRQAFWGLRPPNGVAGKLRYEGADK